MLDVRAMNSQTVRSRPAAPYSCLAATLLSVATAFPQSPTFVRTDFYSLGSDHLVGDFNGDGKLDLAGLWAKTAAIMKRFPRGDRLKCASVGP
jgi:hypothetical protein